jgi:hypothetical protein
LVVQLVLLQLLFIVKKLDKEKTKNSFSSAQVYFLDNFDQLFFNRQIYKGLFKVKVSGVYDRRAKTMVERIRKRS